MHQLVIVTSLIWALAAAQQKETREVTSIDDNVRIDCTPDPGLQNPYNTCNNRGCWWTAAKQDGRNIPWCYFPPNTGYIETSSNDTTIMLKKYGNSPKNPFSDDIQEISLKQIQIGATFNVRIGYEGSYEPPIYLPKDQYDSYEQLSLDRGGKMSSINDKIFTFSITRQSGRRIWDTSIGGMLFGKKFIQIATLLPSDKIYGFGENIHETLKHYFNNYTTWGMFARDQPPQSTGQPVGQNLYGVHPFYLGLEADNKAHGVLILNSNAQEVVTGMGPHLIYRTIGGMLDLFFFPGPEPEQVVQQYQMLIGTPFLPAYWALGFQLSSYSFKTLSDLQEAVNRTIENKIPLDVVHADIDYMDRYKDFTIGKAWRGLGEYVRELHDKGMSLIVILDPAVQANSTAFENAIEQKVSFIEWPQEDLVQKSINDIYPLTKGTNVMLGVVWPDHHVAFPDFLDPQNNTEGWWTSEVNMLHEKVNFDGIWIDMNEPANFGTNEDKPWYWDQKHLQPLMCPLTGPNSHFDMPPYQTINVYQWGYGNVLSSKTLCMLAKTSRNKMRFYDTKNLYGLSESIVSQKALFGSTKKRGVVISRSTFPSSGHYAGHWLGDNRGAWEDLRTSTIGVQEFNLFGIPYVGSDICGYFPGVTEELCLRWQQLGAFHSFSRNHNGEGNPPHDPGVWADVAHAARQANLFRYSYLPYLYSLHFSASVNGGSVIRPVFFEFPNDINTHDLGYQFMWGPAMIVIPALFPSITSVEGYLPLDATWYSLRDEDYGVRIATGKQSISARKDQLPPVFLKGGHIVPRQKPNTTTAASRINPFELVIALDADGGESTGELFWDDGNSIVPNSDFTSHRYIHWTFFLSHKNIIDSTTHFSMSTEKFSGGVEIPKLEVIEIFGYNVTPNFSTFEMRVNDELVSSGIDKSKWSYDAIKHILHIESRDLIDLSKNASIDITWKNTIYVHTTTLTPPPTATASEVPATTTTEIPTSTTTETPTTTTTETPTTTTTETPTTTTTETPSTTTTETPTTTTTETPTTTTTETPTTTTTETPTTTTTETPTTTTTDILTTTTTETPTTTTTETPTTTATETPTTTTTETPTTTTTDIPTTTTTDIPTTTTTETPTTTTTETPTTTTTETPTTTTTETPTTTATVVPTTTTTDIPTTTTTDIPTTTTTETPTTTTTETPTTTTSEVSPNPPTTTSSSNSLDVSINYFVLVIAMLFLQRAHI